MIGGCGSLLHWRAFVFLRYHTSLYVCNDDIDVLEYTQQEHQWEMKVGVGRWGVTTKISFLLWALYWYSSSFNHSFFSALSLFPCRYCVRPSAKAHIFQLWLNHSITNYYQGKTLKIRWEWYLIKYWKGDLRFPLFPYQWRKRWVASGFGLKVTLGGSLFFKDHCTLEICTFQ